MIREILFKKTRNNSKNAHKRYQDLFGDEKTKINNTI